MVSGEEKYFYFVKYFFDNWGNLENYEFFGFYVQDYLFVVEQKEVVGYVVWVVYMYVAMIDIVVLMCDFVYDQAVQQFWENMVGKKMYFIGGIGVWYDGEFFGDNYELFNLMAYSEICVVIGSVYWNYCLYWQYGDVKYYDIIECMFYNGFIVGFFLDGIYFFYFNVMEVDGKYEFNWGVCIWQGWFDCFCCLMNMIWFIFVVVGLLYFKIEDIFLVNLYVGSEVIVEFFSNNLKIK